MLEAEIESNNLEVEFGGRIWSQNLEQKFNFFSNFEICSKLGKFLTFA